MQNHPDIKLKDPRSCYPKPPFPAARKQSLPGSDAAMEPKADHGEQHYRGSGKLQGLVALITGGDSGIGRAVALTYAREGANVAFTYLSEEADARETERLVEAEGRKVISFKIDQSQPNACQEVVATTVKRLGKLDILVNNASYQKTFDDIRDMKPDELENIFRVNIQGMYYFSQAALGHLPPGGSIINTTSIQAFNPSPQLSAYAATKAAIANFSISLAKEAMQHGVRVNGVAPGPVWTPLIPASMPKEKVESFGKQTVFERPAQPIELAPVFVFLASNDASYITGEIYGVTGGMKQY